MRFYAATYCPIILLIFLGFHPTKEQKPCETNHEVSILHPGISLTDSIKQKLIQSKCKSDQSEEFYMDVETVVCGDQQCSIDIVRIVWNVFGFYKRLEIPKNVHLEKAEGEAFSPEDYQKLDSILSNKKSSLKDVYKEEVTGSETSEGVDAYAGETILLDNKSYVKGAVWTCYTLWHWVNGNIHQQIRNITGNEMNSQKLVSYLKSGDEQLQLFALQQLIRKRNYKPSTLATILSQKDILNYPFQKLLIEYAEKGAAENYQFIINQLLHSTNAKLRLLCLNSISKTKLNFDASFYENLLEQIIPSNSYQELDVFLRIIKDSSITSDTITNQLSNALNSIKYIFARRIYWHLINQETSPEIKTTLAAFYEKNKNRL